MFATTEIHKIPVTILSRCQQYELKRISAYELYDHFQKLASSEGFQIEPAALSLIVREAGGSVRDGLSLLDQMFSFGENRITSQDVVEVLGLVSREALMRLTKGLLDGSLSVVLTSLTDIFNFGLDIKRFTEDLMANFRSLLLCKIDGCAGLIDLPTEELTELQTVAAAYTRETLHLKLAMLMAMAEELRFASQPRLTLETSFVKIIEADNVVPVSTLLGHLKEILTSLPACPPTSQVLPEPAKSQLAKDDDPKAKLLPPAIDQPSPPSPSTPPSPEDPKVRAIAEIPQPEEGMDETLSTTDPVAAEIPTPEMKPVKIHPHERDVRKDWLEFISYVKESKLWMAQDLQRADSVKQDAEGNLQLSYSDAANCSLLRQKENRQTLSEFVSDFFQKTLKIRFILPAADDPTESNGNESPNRKRAQLASDPLVIMAAEIFNGEVGDIRIGSHSR